MLDKLNAIEAKYSQIEARLGASETYNDPELVAKLNKEQAELQPLVEVFRTYRRTLDAKVQAEEMMADPELKELAQEEYQAALETLPQLEKELQILLLPRDPNDGKNVIVEIRAGVGGEEAGVDIKSGVMIVSNGFHLTRARMLAGRAGFENISTLAAPSSHVPSRLKMYIREPLALVKSFVLDR